MATIRRDHTGKNKKGITPAFSAGNTPLRGTPTNLYPSKTNNYLIAQYHHYSSSSPKRPNYLRSTVSSATTPTDVSKQPGEKKPPANDNIAPKPTITRRKPSDKTPTMPVVLKPRVSTNIFVRSPSPFNGKTNVGPQKPVSQKSVPQTPVIQKPVPKKPVPQKNVPTKILRAPIKDPLKQRSSSSTKPLSTVRKSVVSCIKKKQETRNSTSLVRKEKISIIASHEKVEKNTKILVVPEQVTPPRAQEPSMVECDDHVRQPYYQESSIVEGSDHDHQTEQVVTINGKGTDDHETEQVVPKSEKATDDHQKEQVVSKNEKGTDDLVVEVQECMSIGKKEVETDDTVANIVIPEASRVLEEPSPILAVKTEEIEEKPTVEEASSKNQEIEKLYVNEVDRSIACEVKLRITYASVEKDNPPSEEAKKKEETELSNTGIEVQETKEIKGQQLVEEKKQKAGNIAAAAQEKKESTVSNCVIEETASKLHEHRKNRVKALAGAFETVISKQEK